MRLMLCVTSLALFCVMPATAQQPSPQPQKSSSNQDDLKTVTVVGCLQTAAQPNQFVLMSTADPLAKGVAVAMSGVVPNVTYQLSGGSNLAAHVGHRVSITGATSGKAQKAVATSSTVKTAEAPGPDTKVETTEKAAIELRDLRIESLKMVSTNCKTP